MSGSAGHLDSRTALGGESFLDKMVVGCGMYSPSGTTDSYNDRAFVASLKRNDRCVAGSTCSLGIRRADISANGSYGSGGNSWS